MEIEAKYCVPDERRFEQLLGLTSLAGYELGPVSVASLSDVYLDTADRAILAGGFACRLRREGVRTLATLKGLGTAVGAVHRRVELEIELPEKETELAPPQRWPASAARDQALRLAGSQSLVPLFRLEQLRHSRPMRQGRRTAAELHLDRVHVILGQTTAAAYLELEAELAAAGREDDLDALATVLDVWGLEPESRSKFQRALALADLKPNP